MKTYFRTNNPNENNAIKDLKENKQVKWGGNSKYSPSDFVLVYITKFRSRTENCFTCQS